MERNQEERELKELMEIILEKFAKMEKSFESLLFLLKEEVTKRENAMRLVQELTEEIRRMSEEIKK